MDSTRSTYRSADDSAAQYLWHGLLIAGVKQSSADYHAKAPNRCKTR